MTTAFKGCMFDFSGTLLRVEPTDRWLRGAPAEAGLSPPEAEVARHAERLERAGPLPGGGAPERVPPSVAGLWAERDKDAQRHRAAYTALAGEGRRTGPDGTGADGLGRSAPRP